LTVTIEPADAAERRNRRARPARADTGISGQAGRKGTARRREDDVPFPWVWRVFEKYIISRELKVPGYFVWKRRSEIAPWSLPPR
jgi:hypothetical protein